MMYEVDKYGNVEWLNPSEEMGVLRLLVPKLHEKIAEQRTEIDQLRTQADAACEAFQAGYEAASHDHQSTLKAILDGGSDLREPMR